MTNPTNDLHASPENERDQIHEPTIEQIVSPARKIIERQDADQFTEFEAVREVLLRWGYAVLALEELGEIVRRLEATHITGIEELPEQIESVHDAARIAKLVGDITRTEKLCDRAVTIAEAELEKAKALALAEALPNYDKKWQFEEAKPEILDGSDAVKQAQDTLEQTIKTQIDAAATKARVATIEQLTRAMLYSRQGSRTYMTMGELPEEEPYEPELGDPWPVDEDGSTDGAGD